jgi:hypothetical protein
MNKNLERLLSLLKAEADVIDSINKTAPFRYKSNQRLVLENGKAFLTRVEHPKFRGELQQCFQNCFEILLTHPELSYCEGFGTDDNMLLAVPHGWLINKDMQVIDPTWIDEKSTGSVYFGVVFKSKFVFDIARKTKHYGILDTDYLNNYQLLREGFQSGALHSKFHNSSSESRSPG